MPPNAEDATTLHVRRALAGSPESVAWIVGRFTPLLHAQAAVRLTPALRRAVDPEDLVQETWAVALPKLDVLASRDDRFTPVLVRFLSQTLLNVLNARARKEARRLALGAASPARTDADPLQQVADRAAGPPTASVAREREDTLARALADLDRSDREILVLRLVEQQPVADVAAQLDISTTAVTSRLHRAVQRLRGHIGASVIDELVT